MPFCNCSINRTNTAYYIMDHRCNLAKAMNSGRNSFPSNLYTATVRTRLNSFARLLETRPNYETDRPLTNANYSFIFTFYAREMMSSRENPGLTNLPAFRTSTLYTFRITASSITACYVVWELENISASFSLSGQSAHFTMQSYSHTQLTILVSKSLLGFLFFRFSKMGQAYIGRQGHLRPSLCLP